MRTLILMADTRHPVHTDIYSAPFYSHASVINLSYARQHGYDFSYYLVDPGGSEGKQCDAASHDAVPTALQRVRALTAFECDVWAMRAVQMASPFLKKAWLERQTRVSYRYRALRDALLLRGTRATESPSRHTGEWCRHVKWGARAPAWGKLLALRHGLELNYERVVYIDSDAIFAASQTSLEAFLQMSSGSPTQSQSPTLIVFSNFPWTYVDANSGFMIWHNSARARALLDAWWNVDAGRYNLSHDWEQHGLNAHLLREGADGYRQQITILPDVCLLEQKGQFVRHITSPHAWEREPRMRLGLRQAKITAARYERLMDALARRHLVRLDTALERPGSE